jgi:hypothetical protein
MLRLSLRLARRSTSSAPAQHWAQKIPTRSFGISRHAHERWNDEEPEDENQKNRSDGPMISPDDMELYQYNPQAILQSQQSEDDAQEEEDKRVQKVRDELDTRTGRGWSDPWEISETEWAAPTEHDDLPDWTPANASKLSMERVSVGGVPTLSELSKMVLPPPPPPHPSSKDAKLFAAARKQHQYKYILSRVAATVKPSLEEIKKLPTWEAKQDAVDELFETVEFHLKEQEQVLGRHPRFGYWVEKALEEYLYTMQNEKGDEETDEEKDEKAIPVFIDLYDETDALEEDEEAPVVPKILHPLKPHHRDGYGRMVEEWELSAHSETRRIMLRQSTREIARILDENDTARVYVNGDKGVGKTAALLSVVAAARKSGHIVLYAPDGDRLRKYGFYVEPSTAHEGIFDLPMLAQEMCVNLLESHARDFEGMNVTKETRDKHLSDDIKKRMPEGTMDELSVLGLLKLAKEEAFFATMCYSSVVETLSNQEEKPFLIVLDEYNCYYDHGHYFHMDYDEDVKESIPFEKLSLFKPFMDSMGLGDKPPVPIKRGGIVVGVSENRAIARSTTDALTASASRAAAEVDSTMHVVTVPRYSILEVEHILSNFDLTGIGRLRFDKGDTVIDEQEVSYLRMLSGSNGQLLLDAVIV